MKKTLLTMICCILTAFTIAQQKLSKEAEDFNTYTKTLDESRRAASEKKDYPEAVKLIVEWIGKYERSSVAVKSAALQFYPGFYYNLACYQNLSGKKDAALTAFEKSVTLGYSNYVNTLQDTDLESLHQDKRFKVALQKLREKGDMNYVLKKAEPYVNEKVESLPAFTYQSANAPELLKLKEDFNLDSVAGKGDEVSKLKNLLFWVHNAVRHDGGSDNPPSRNARDLIAVCQKENRGVNCRMMATILRDAYQAEGFKARMVTCMPKDTADFDCHVITVVWAKSLNKWVWMDPTFNAYVSDAKGNLLNIEEVRERLINNSDLVLNEDANWNNKSKQTKEYYLGYYMSKNLYWIQCASNSTWNVETRKENAVPSKYVNLYPGKFTTLKTLKKGAGASDTYAISNPAVFWQKPADD
jgi:hypothetical protein